MEPATMMLILKAAGAIFTTGKGIAQTVKQRKLQKKADREAAKAMTEMEAIFDKNTYENLGIPKEVYEMQREATLATAASYTQAAQEGSQRGVGAVTGQGLQAAQAAQAQISAAQAQQMFELDKLIAGEEARKDQMKAIAKMQNIQGAQAASRQAADAAERGSETTAAGVMGMIGVGLEAVPLITGDRDKKKALEGLMDKKSSEGLSDQDFISNLAKAFNMEQKAGQTDAAFKAEVETALIEKDAATLNKLTELLFTPPPAPTSTPNPYGVPIMATPPPPAQPNLSPVFGGMGGYIDPMTGQIRY